MPALGGPMGRGRCKVGNPAVDGPQSWCESTLVVLWEDSMVLEVVLLAAAKKEIVPKNTSLDSSCCCCLVQWFAVWLWCYLLFFP